MTKEEDLREVADALIAALNKVADLFGEEADDLRELIAQAEAALRRIDAGE